jgi:hypothetical protein
MGTVEGWKKLIDIVPSKSNGITFDCGVTREMGHDPVEVCRYFGSRDRINHVHFRNVIVEKPYEHYEEVFIDEGYNNMFAVMKELVRQKYPRMVYPEHPRAIDYDRAQPGFRPTYPGGGGYAAFAYNVGYAKAMLQACLNPALCITSFKPGLIASCLFEKPLQHRGGFRAQHALHDFDAMVEQRRIRNLKLAPHAAEPQIARTEHQRLHASRHQSPCAHRAGLERAVERRLRQPVVADGDRSLPQSQHLGVSGGVKHLNRRVPPHADDLVVHHQHATHGHLAALLRLATEFQRAAHPFLVLV